MFAPFTRGEVESIRSIVLIGQHKDDMLLSNCSSRPIAQTRSFIRRFKSLLLDTEVAVPDITRSANEQYVAIIAGVRVKRSPEHHRMPNATSMSNLSLNQTVPFKFRVRFNRLDSESEQPQRPLPTRSRSVAQGLVLPDRLPEVQIPPVAKFSAGQIVSISVNPPGHCRILGFTKVNGRQHAFVAFFQPDRKPAYVDVSQLRVLPEQRSPQDTTVDSLLECWVRECYALVLEMCPVVPSDPEAQQRSTVVFQRTLACAVQMSLLNFVAHYRAPGEKVAMMLQAIFTIHPPKFTSSTIVDARSKELVTRIVESMAQF
jgi:hypothetical protein